MPNYLIRFSFQDIHCFNEAFFHIMISGQLCHPDIFYLNIRKKKYQGEFNSKMKNTLFIEEVYSDQCMHDSIFNAFMNKLIR